MQEDRDRFDALVAEVIDALPAVVQGWIDEVPVVVIDAPTDEMLASLEIDPREARRAREELCGLHTGVMLTERSLEVPETRALDQIHLFRVGIIREARGWDWEDDRAQKRLREEIRITLLHELGHHFGLEEDELRQLGYG